jgi:CHAT domain-containing protein/tetratricopeptide (TPR) repeat protein
MPFISGLAVGVLLGLPPAAADTPLLDSDEPLTLTLELSDGRSEAGTLAGTSARGKLLRVRVEEPGVYTVDLRSATFDAYLVLTAADGVVLAEDDNGWTGTQARLAVELEPDQEYFVHACALESGVGMFEISLHSGRRSIATAEERRSAELDDFQWTWEQLERELDDERELFWALQRLGASWFDRGYVEEALWVFQHRIELSTGTFGGEDSLTAIAHYERAYYLFRLSRMDEAEPEMRAAVNSLIETLGPNDETTLSTYGGLGHLELGRGRYRAASDWFQRAVDGYIARSEGDTESGIMADINLATTLVSLGELPIARELAERAVSNAEKLGPAGEYLLSMAMSGPLSELEQFEGHYEAAYELMTRARDIDRKTLPPTHGNRITLDVNILVVLQNLDRPEETRRLGEDLLVRLAQASRNGGSDHAGLLLVLSKVERRSGNNDLAIVLARDSIQIAQAIGDGGHLAHGLMQLAKAHQSAGNLAEAREPLEQSIRLLRDNEGESYAVATGTHDLGSLLYTLGDFELAADAFRRAGEWYEAADSPIRLTESLSGLGLALLQLDRGDEALIAVRRALTLAEAELPPGRRFNKLENLAVVYEHRGELDEALDLFQRAADDLKQRSSVERLQQAILLGNIASVRRRLGDARGAREDAARALELAPQFAIGSNLAVVDALALSCLDLGDTDAAWSRVMQGAALRRTRTDAVLASMSEPERYRYLERMLSHLDHVLAIARTLGDPAARTAAYEEALHWKGIVGRQLYATSERLAGELPPEIRTLADQLREGRAALARTIDGADEARIDSIRAEVASLERRLQAQLDLGNSASAISFAELRDALPEHAVAVDFVVHRRFDGAAQGAPTTLGESIVTAFVTRPGVAAPTRVELGSSAAMEAALGAHFASLGVGSSSTSALAARGRGLGRDVQPSAGPLRELLWRPLAPHLTGASTLFVVPEGALATLPFETLLLLDDRFLIEEFTVVTLSDIGLLVRSEAPSKAAFGSLLVLGDVDYGRREALDVATTPSMLRTGMRGVWSPLPATGVELGDILEAHTEVFGADAPRLELRGAAATEERLLGELAHFGTVHLATHGYFQPEGLVSSWDAARSRDSRAGARLVGRRPGLLSGLVCAGANVKSADRADGYLTAEELGSADLTGIELVVLSACETGLGRAQAGEGLLGVRRAFITSGANTVVSSLWSVPDSPTADLMRAFYTRLWRDGLGRRAALRAAQLELLERNRRELGRPDVLTWGAFVLDGEWR